MTVAPWSDGSITASCHRGHTEVPAKDCSCGVYAYYDPCPRTASTATPDLIGGVAVLWGRIEAHIYGLRGEHAAAIIAFELPLSRGRKRRAVVEAAERVAVPVVPHHSLKALALEHGAPLQPALRPKKTLTRASNVWARNGPA